MPVSFWAPYSTPLVFMSVRMVWGEYIFFFLCLIHGRWDEYLAFLENHSSWWWLAQYESSLEVIWEWHFIIICLQCGRPECDPCVCKVPWRREWQLTPVFLPGKFHGQRKLAGYSPWGCWELDSTEWITLSLFTNLVSSFKWKCFSTKWWGGKNCNSSIYL